MNINFNNEDLKLLNEALLQMPYFKVAGLIDKINKQITTQINQSDPEQDK